FSRQKLACNIDVFAPRLLSFLERGSHVASLALAGKLDEHRQVHASNDLHTPRLHHRYGQLRRRTAKHVRQHYDASAEVSTRNRLHNVAAALLHIIIGADGDRLETLLRADDMLKRIAELVGKPTVRDEHESDHYSMAPVFTGRCCHGPSQARFEIGRAHV